MPDTQTNEDAGLQSLRRPGSVMERTARGAGWIIFWRFSTRGLGLISTLVLARLLSPTDFGVVALAISFIHGLQALAELGTENAIIRADVPDRALYNTGFTINALRGVGVAIVLLIGAYPAAAFFHNPHLAPVVMVAAVISVLGGLENIGVVDFRRFIAFEQEFKLKLVPRVFQVIVAITLGFILRNYWALIIAILLSQAITTFLTYYMHPFRPRFTLSAWHRMASYSTLLWMTSIVQLVQGLSTQTVLGRLAGVGAVGVFSTGAELASLPNSEVIGPLCRAAFSGFAEIKKNNDAGAAMLVRMVGLMAMLMFPAGVGLSLVADPVVRLGFGPQWTGAIPVLEILGLFSGLSTFAMVSQTVFAVQAWMKAGLKVQFGLAIIQLILLFFLVPRFGLAGGAAAGVATGLVGQTILFGTTMRRMKIHPMTVARQIWRSVAGCAAMAAVLVHFGLGWSSMSGSAGTLGMRLAEAVTLGAIAYVVAVGILWLLSGRPEGPERDMVYQMRRFRRRSPAVA